jgi:hypothetical protein
MKRWMDQVADGLVAATFALWALTIVLAVAR